MSETGAGEPVRLAPAFDREAGAHDRAEAKFAVEDGAEILATERARLLAAYLNLLDASGKYNPGGDKVLDAVSIGLGFTAVLGTFSLPTDLATE